MLAVADQASEAVLKRAEEPDSVTASLPFQPRSQGGFQGRQGPVASVAAPDASGKRNDAQSLPTHSLPDQFSTDGNVPFCSTGQPVQNSSTEQPAHVKDSLVSQGTLHGVGSQDAASASSVDKRNADQISQLPVSPAAQHADLSFTAAAASDAAMPGRDSRQSGTLPTQCVSFSDAAFRSGHAGNTSQRAQSCPQWHNHAQYTASMNTEGEGSLRPLLQALADAVNNFKQNHVSACQHAADKQQ